MPILSSPPLPQTQPHDVAVTLASPGSGEMFDAIASRYDRLNRLLSLGLDRGWRRRMVKTLKLPAAAHVLDVASGTADVALQVAKSHPDATVIGVDPSRQMLRIGAEKVGAGRFDNIRLEVGDAQQLPFEAASFDAVTIAFGIRNVVDRPRALREMVRVTRAGGSIAVLELTEPQRGGVWSRLVQFYIRRIVPWIGGRLSASREYRYLQTSIAAFPAPAAFATMMREAGITDVRLQSLGFGACCLYVGHTPTP